MSKLSRVASALSFAHLVGIGSMRGKKAGAEDEEDDRKKGSRAEDDQDEEDEDDESDKTDKKSRKAKRAKAGEDAGEDAGDDEDLDDDDDDDEGEEKDKGKKSKRAKAKADDDDADAEDDDDEEMHGKSTAAAARLRERARCAEIFGSRYAARNPVLAANLAFNTTMSREQAINVLRDTPAEGNTNSARSGKNPVLGSAGTESPSRAAAIAGRWDRAMTKARGK
jgi:hypothetical protein